MVTSIQFLIGFIAFVLVFSAFLDLANQQSIGDASYIPIPIFPTQTEAETNFLDDLTAIIGFVFEMVGYYMALFTSNDFVSFVTVFIIFPAMMIALFIFITEVVIPFIVAIGGLIPFTYIDLRKFFVSILPFVFCLLLLVTPVVAIEVTESYTRCDFDEELFIDECETELEYEEASPEELLILNEMEINFIQHLTQKDEGDKAITFTHYEFSPNKIKIKGWIPQATQNYWGIAGGIWNSSWFNASFEKCKNWSINNEIEGYRMAINITADDFDSNMKDNFRDFRPVNTSCNNNGTMLSYLERTIVNDTWATFDVLLDNSTTHSIYYDCEPDCVSLSSADDVWGTDLTYYFIKDEYTGALTTDIIGDHIGSITTPDWISGYKFGGLNYSALLSVITHAGDHADYEAENTFSFSFYITRHGATPQFTRVLEKHHSAGAPYVSYGLNMYEQAGSSGEPCCVYGSGSTTTRLYFNTTLVDHQTYLIHCIYNSTHLTGYLNGTLDTTTQAYSSSIAYTSGNLTFGNRVGNGNQFTGEIDEVMFWKRALTPSETGSHYTEVVPYTVEFGSEEEQPEDDPDDPVANLTNGTYINYSCTGNYSLTNATTISGDTNTSVLTYIYCKNGCNEANLVITIWGNEASLCNPELWLQVIYFITVVAVVIWGIRRIT